MAPFASLARGLAALILVTLYSEMSANRQEFQEDDWTFYIISAGICAFLAARAASDGAPPPPARLAPPRAPRRARARRGKKRRVPQAYGIGANDVANAFATSVGSKAITVKQAVMIASVFEFLGAVLMGSNVSKTIRKGIADVGCFEDNPGLLIYGMTCVIISVGVWLILASYLEMPVSTTHSCVGGIIGMTMMTRGKGCVIWNYTRNDYGNGTTNMAFENFPWLDGVSEIVVSWVLSPVASGCCAAALYGIIRLTVLRAENAYWRAKVSFPVIVGVTFAINSCYWIVKGTKGQPERFGTAGLVREAKAGNLVPTIVIGCYVGLAAAACAAASLPYITKQIEAQGDLAALPGDDDVEATAADAECKTPPKDDEVREATKEGGVDVAGYVAGALAKDQFAVLKTDETVGAIHANLERHDAKAEAFFRYVQVFTATVDAFSHGANDVANAMGPFAAAYVAYKKGKVVKSRR
ncbi:inorganic phosphate transmembrane transporter [Aureococcus anophagefferens]|nr:inorganic phosphate transmembrane transporter [Aureococcus anophagefferens]